MVGRTNIGSKKRYDDMIGFLVAFEKRAKTMEVCCDLNKDVISTNESTSSETVPPSHVRHAGSIKRSQRGRLTNPVQKVSENVKSKNAAERDISDPINAKDHMILAVSDIVEVIMNGNESEDQTKMHYNLFSALDTVLPNFTQKLEKLVNPDIDYVTASEILEIITVSSSQSFVVDMPPPLKRGNSGRYEGKFQDSFPIDANHIAQSQKSQDTSILRPSSISREHQPSRLIDEQNILRETKANKKIVGVAFRQPINEVIPSKRDSSDCIVYTVGDIVEITGGIHRQRTGRIVKRLGDMVQLDVGVCKPQYMFISTNMLLSRSEA